MLHLHKWGPWEDVKVADRSEINPLMVMSVFMVRQVITQQRRCSVCNLVKTKVS